MSLYTMNLKKVQEFYPKSTILGVDEIFVRGEGWKFVQFEGIEKLERILVLGTLPEFEDKIEHVNLKIQTEYGQIVYADFNVSELVKKVAPKKTQSVLRGVPRKERGNCSYGIGSGFFDDIK